MSRFLTGNLFLVLSMLCTAGSHVLIKALLADGPRFQLSWDALQAAMTHRNLPRWILAGGMLGVGFVLWLLCLDRLDLSYAYPIACSSVLLVALFSGIFLGETVTLKMWSGTVLILIGVVLLTPAG